MADSDGPNSRASQLGDGVDEAVWRYALAERASVLIDAEDYFECMQDAMLKAEQRILLIGWDFDTRIHLSHGRRWWQRPFRSNHPSRLGSFVTWLVRHQPDLDLRILEWRVSVLNYLTRGIMMWDLLRWLRHRRVHFKLDHAHPIGCSHHQKLAILDGRLAVCGGIDMTEKRWDTRDHLEDDPRRKTAGGGAYGPWHDATMMMEGDIAGALADLAHDRWYRAGGEKLRTLEPVSDSRWPDRLSVQFENVEVGIARTRACHREWREVSEIKALFLRHIRGAKRFIYAESQYFASRAVAEAIAERLEEDDPPEIVIVHPAHADGWLEQQAMDHARAELFRAIKAVDRHDRFSLWTPFAGDTPIYVHAKLMIIDDEILRIGSANLNNRSLGLDSECDVFIDSAREGNAHAVDGIAHLRYSLLAEHLGIEEDGIPGLLREAGSMRAAIESFGRQNTRHLRPYELPAMTGAARAIADLEVLDPETPGEMFETFARRGLFRKGGRLARLRDRAKRIRKKIR
ncbi:phospholipase D-like domain-containing protein [Qipengyuania sp.]|uniref:phospholipase D-like domain-containing protein n=1 Tax=Qipengyuania sp. TaxID=2004515 RepID=UPI0035C82AA9